MKTKKNKEFHWPIEKNVFRFRLILRTGLIGIAEEKRNYARSEHLFFFLFYKFINFGFHTVRYGTVEPVTAAVWYRGKISRDIQ